MEYSWDDMVEKFNNNDLDVQKYFNDYGTFFSILKKRGLMGEVDPKNASGSEDWQNEYLLWLYENDKENYYKWIPSLLDDVIFENGIAYLEISDRGDLAKLFCDGNRYDLSRDTIETILSGDGDAYEPYWDTTQDVYSDVIEELTPENDKRLGEYIVNVLKGQQISADTDELQLIASEQGHPEYVEVSMENVKRIIDDKESMNQLLQDELADLKSELYSIHSSAYNSAYEESVWAEIWSELGTYFEGDGEWISKPHPYKKNTEIQYFKIPIKDFDAQVNDYLFNSKGYGNSGTLEYHGGFIEIMKEDRDCLSAQAPDYPDSRKVDKNINEFLKEYI
jgi:hypothetical protein